MNIRIVVCCAILFLSCRAEPPQDTPEAAYRAFAEAVKKTDEDASFARISAASKRVLGEAAQEAAKLRDVPANDDGRRLMLQSGGRSAAPIATIVEKSRTDTKAVLVVTDSTGAAREVPLVREDAAWKVDLAAMLTAP